MEKNKTTTRKPFSLSLFSKGLSTSLFFIFALFPLGVCFSLLTLAWKKGEKEKQELTYLIELASSSSSQRALRKTFLDKHVGAYFEDVEKKLASLSLFSPEKEQIEELSKHPGSFFLLSKEAKDLLDRDNQCSWVKKEKNSSSLIKENAVKLKTPLLINSSDLQALLSLIEEEQWIEGELQKKPQLLIKDFTLHKQELLGLSSYLVDMEILERQFLKKTPSTRKR